MIYYTSCPQGKANKKYFKNFSKKLKKSVIICLTRYCGLWYSIQAVFESLSQKRSALSCSLGKSRLKME